MEYESKTPFEGSTEKAFDLAMASLTSIGFRLTSRDGATLEFGGPGLNSTRQSALLGASRIRITHVGRELSLLAELGGVRGMARFLYLFPAGLSLSLFAILFIVFSFVFDGRQWLAPLGTALILIVLVWLVLAPIMARAVRGRTSQALDALLNNIAVAGRSL